VRKLIVTADDFGLDVAVNEAVEEAHRRGVLTTAGLMVGAPAAQDAVERARRLGTLEVGLHVTLVRGRPVLPPAEVPDLVDRNGEFHWNLVRAGVAFFFLPAVRRQLEREIRAQFEAFARTGLEPGHVDVHNHMHLHPTILALVLEIGRDFRMRSMRLPAEPGGSVALAPWLALLRRRLREAGMVTNDWVLGLEHSGAMDTARLIELLGRLPDGVTEIYFHPATRSSPAIERALPGYRCRAEYEALVSEEVRRAIEAAGAELTSFRHLWLAKEEQERCCVH
jgi:hopanoid biosynthesis associated protein HpnK